MVRIPGFHYGLGSVPGQEIEILQVFGVQPKKKKKKTNKNRKKHQPNKFHENFILLLPALDSLLLRI